MSIRFLLTRGLSPKQFVAAASDPDESGRGSLRRKFRFILILNGLVFLWLVLKPARPAVIATVDNIVTTLAPLIAAVWCGLALRRPRPTKPSEHPAYARRLSALMLGLGVLSYGIGEVIWSYYEIILHRQTPFPSWSDVAFVAAYPLLLAGILLLPNRRIAPELRGRIVLDGLMTMTAIITFSWYFVLGPTLYQASETLLGKVLGAGYPIGDLLLLFCLLVLSARAGGAREAHVVRSLAVGLSAVIAADTAFWYLTLQKTYHTGNIFDAGWSLGYMLIAYGACAALQTPVTVCAGDRVEIDSAGRAALTSSPVWRSLTPYAFMPAVAGLLLYTRSVQGDENLERGVYAGSAALLGFVLARQVLAILENGRLNRRLSEANRQLETQNRQLEAMVHTDSMTGLENHGAFQERLQTAAARAAEEGYPVSLLMLDIDFFKRYNDAYGHPAGDTVLKMVASLLRGAVADCGFAARYGGEEFAILLPDRGLGESEAVAEAIRATIAAHPFPYAQVTISIGVASVSGDGAAAGGLLAAADRALYAAKYAGRNRVAVWDDVSGRAVDRVVEEVHPLLLDSTQRPSPALVPTGGERRFLKSVLHGPEGEIVVGLLTALDLRERETEGHSRRVACFTLRLAQEAMRLGIVSLTPADLSDLVYGALLHDVGKIGVPDQVLRKAGKLSEEDWHAIYRHPGEGAELMAKFSLLGGALTIVRHHHERWDGTGYPDGLRGEEIPVTARLIAIADAFDAMASDRSYRERMSFAAIRKEIERVSGAQFDPNLVHAFLQIPEQDWTRLQQEVAADHESLDAAHANLPKAA